MSGEEIETSLTAPFKQAHDYYATRPRDGYTDAIHDGVGHCCPGISYDNSYVRCASTGERTAAYTGPMASAI